MDYFCIRQSIKDVPSSIATARCGATPNHASVCKLSRRSCKRIEPSSVKGCFVAVRRKERLFRLLQLAHYCEITSDWIKYIPALVSRRLTDICVSFVETTYNIRSLYPALDLRATSVGVGANSYGPMMSAVTRSGFVMEG